VARAVRGPTPACVINRHAFRIAVGHLGHAGLERPGPRLEPRQEFDSSRRRVVGGAEPARSTESARVA
jgi:hypothetical protein